MLELDRNSRVTGHEVHLTLLSEHLKKTSTGRLIVFRPQHWVDKHNCGPSTHHESPLTVTGLAEAAGWSDLLDWTQWELVLLEWDHHSLKGNNLAATFWFSSWLDGQVCLLPHSVRVDIQCCKEPMEEMVCEKFFLLEDFISNGEFGLVCIQLIHLFIHLHHKKWIRWSVYLHVWGNFKQKCRIYCGFRFSNVKIWL